MAVIMQHGKKVLAGNFILSEDKKSLLLLYRPDNQHWETPGGKVEDTDCVDPQNPTIADYAKAAARELQEELGGGCEYMPLEYFGVREFCIPGKIEAYAHKFVTQIMSGEPCIAEFVFTDMQYLPIAQLAEYPISPDLQLFLKELQEMY